MLRAGQLARAKGVLAELLAQAYRWRDPVALLGFGGAGSALVLAPGRALQDAGGALAPLAGGGGTPLGAALQDADALLRRHRQGQRWLWLLTDGRTREQPPRPAWADWLCVIDFDTARPPWAVPQRWPSPGRPTICARRMAGAEGAGRLCVVRWVFCLGRSA